MHSKKNIAIIANDPEMLADLNREFGIFGDLKFHAYKDIGEFLNTGHKIPWSGIIVDFRTMFKAPEHKAALFKLGEVFPFLRLNMNDKSRITAVYNDQNLTTDRIISDFFEKAVREFSQRHLRKAPRINLVLNLEYMPEGSKEGFKRSFTTNVSEYGMFIVSTDPMQYAEPIIVRFRELADQEPAICRICWTMPWGQGVGKIPGYGVEFMEIKDSQLATLKQHLYGRR